MASQLPESYANHPSTTLDGGINSDDTTITVMSSAGFPADGQFRAAIGGELLIVTEIDGLDWTVERGAEGTTPAAHDSGAAVVHPLTKGSIVRASNRVDPAGTRSHGRVYSANFEGVTFNSGTTRTLLNYNDGPGCLRQFAVFISSASQSVRELSYLNVFIDGELTATIDGQDLAAMHMADHAPLSFIQRRIGFKNVVSDQNVGYVNHFAMPWTTGIKIDLVNSGDGDGTLWWNGLYSTGATLDWGRRKRFHTNTVRDTAVVAYAEVELMNATGRGVLEGIYFRGENANGFTFLEGNIEIYIDGELTPSIFFTGTEDYFLQSNYYAGGVIIGDQYGCVRRDTGSGSDVGCYRFHLDDPIEFEESIRVVWYCGDPLQNGGVTGTTDLTTCVYWYTDE